ncbi:11143_t:CDS:2 [Paraglomus brasilianum]|uniref:11143_t:CDS:1 n=1 Tax=Paraglomus brasilianum TaxID=144538 RepID=A0A9N9GIW8_9GLOM|nr:11143_t:CDS:2 [Paraglomus brasilianum]
MLNKNKQKAPANAPQLTNKGPSSKKPSPFSFANTECKLSYDAQVSNREVPKTDLINSLFFDLRNLQVTEEQLFEAIQDDIMGIAYRQESGFLEVTFSEQEDVKKYLTEGLTIDDKPIIPLPPRDLKPRILRVKLANVPMHLSKARLEQDIKSYWGQYACVKAIAPYTYKGTAILTRRWDLIVYLKPEANALEAPVVWEYQGSKVLATWRGAPASCLSCKSAGHYSSVCPTFPPKRKTTETLKKTISKHVTSTPETNTHNDETLNKVPLASSSKAPIASTSKATTTPGATNIPPVAPQQFHTPPAQLMSYASVTAAGDLFTGNSLDQEMRDQYYEQEYNLNQNLTSASESPFAGDDEQMANQYLPPDNDEEMTL